MQAGDQPVMLLIDDDPLVRRTVAVLLQRAGYRVVEAGSGEEGLRALFDLRPGAILLDVLMPGMDGFAVLRRIRDLTSTPVIMLSGAASEEEKVRALRAGADDYITKPYGRQELLARVEAVLRRAGASMAAPDRDIYDDGLLRIDHKRREVSVNGTNVDLPPLEYRLLTALTEHPGQVLSHDQLLELVWGGADRVGRGQVKLAVSRLRRSLATVGGETPRIEARRGFGYRFDPPR